MSTTLDTLIQQIKIASSPGENTANRIGTTLELLNSEKITSEYGYSKAETEALISSIPVDTVNTVNELRSTNLTEGDAISLLGYYTAGDKRPLTYVYTLLNYGSLVDDGGAIIKTSVGSWIALFGGYIDARDYGCANSLEDNSSIFNIMVARNPNMKILVEGLNLKFSSSLIFNSKIKLQGVVRGTIFDFTALPASEYAMRLCSTAAINGFELEGIRFIGASTNNWIRINQTNNINFSLTDSIFRDLRVEGFNIGLQSNYMWCNTFINVRLNGCIEPLILNSQSNQLMFLRCSLVSYKKAIKHTNCEGVTYDTCNIANFNLASDPDATQGFLSLFQSNVTIINPYFELVDKGVLAVGGSGEVNKSSLSILGGKTTDDSVKIRVNGDDTKMSLKGLNNKNGKDIYALENVSNVISPTVYLREIYLDNKQYNKDNVIAKFDGNQAWPFGTFGGGASNSISVDKGFKRIQMNGSVNTGFRMTNNLIVDEYYTLVYMVNKRSATGTFRIHHGTDYQVLNIQNLGDNYELRFVPFKAMGTNLDFACTVVGDIFDIRYLLLVKGNYLPDYFDKTYIPHAPALPTAIGDFVDGDIVKSSTAGDTYYTLVSGAWQAVKLMKQSAAVIDVSATNASSISTTDLVTVTSPDATDLPTALTLLNEIKGKYNLNVPLTNEIKSKYNTVVTLSNSNKTQLNAKLLSDRNSGQQA